MHIIIHETGHLIIYTILALILFIFIRKKDFYGNYLIGLLVTIFLDLDHLLDYFRYKGLYFNLSDFLSGTYFEASQRIIVIFHSWEFAFLFLAIFFFQKQKTHKLLFIFIGILAHLIFDSLYYGFDLNDYFFVKRMIEGFSIFVFS